MTKDYMRPQRFENPNVFRFRASFHYDERLNASVRVF